MAGLHFELIMHTRYVLPVGKAINWRWRLSVHGLRIAIANDMPPLQQLQPLQLRTFPEMMIGISRGTCVGIEPQGQACRAYGRIPGIR